MKTQLWSARLTLEDRNIWDLVVERAGWNGIAHCARVLHADRRDADLMLALEQIMPAVKFGQVWGRAHRRMTIGIGTLRTDPWVDLRPVGMT